MMTEQERQDRLWLEPEPLKEYYRERPDRMPLRWAQFVLIPLTIVGVGFVAVYGWVVERLRTRRT